ncbi:class I SAM-dependent methyltransferase [Aliiruegeria sabulilitoris]|uniref:class I SAM-dependent methyltransferase n=1 Tax=Aliiruegeria sabulilitoris TaxID=1510458 RepID=UPI00082F7669|nr:class I SAM-dependent methyltransferase [Aliiruegeria sabulilitoris]NDR58000.1 class I SAM-dependent methyltransferase [Pseudoruegeria sp. M32A2M]
MQRSFGEKKQDTWPETAAIRRLVASLATELEKLPHSGAAIPPEILKLGRAIGDLARSNAMSLGNADAVKAQVIRGWISSWPRIEALLQAQCPAVARPLFPEFEDPLHPRRLQAELANQFAHGQHRLLNTLTQDADTEVEGAFSDISLPLSVFLENIHAACRVLLALGRYEDRRFVDIGCGSGEKLLAAAPCFERVTGVEIDPGYAALARDITHRARIGNADIVETDARIYEGCPQQDVIYFYRPMRYPKALAQLESQVVETCRAGTLLIAPYEGFRYKFKELGCAHLGGFLYVSGLKDAEAEALRKKAELIGPHVHREQPELPQVWGPILEASRLRGFSPLANRYSGTW